VQAAIDIDPGAWTLDGKVEPPRERPVARLVRLAVVDGSQVVHHVARDRHRRVAHRDSSRRRLRQAAWPIEDGGRNKALTRWTTYDTRSVPYVTSSEGDKK
jgi:hypothetical protein